MFTDSITVSVIVSKMGVFFCQAWSKSQWTVLLGYLIISIDVRCHQHIIDYNFIFQQDSALVHLSFNTVQLQQCKTLNFLSPKLWPHNSPELNSTDCEIQEVIQQHEYELEVITLNKYALVAKIQPVEVVRCCPDGDFWGLLRPVFAASRKQHISDLHSKFALGPRHVQKYGRHPICGR